MTKFRKLGRPTGHRMSMLRTMVSQLVKPERIETIVAKGTLRAARRAAGFVRGDDVLHNLFTELAYRYKWIHQIASDHIRVGDAAPMAYIKFIDQENELRQAKPPTPPPPQRAPLDPWTHLVSLRQFAPPKRGKIRI